VANTCNGVTPRGVPKENQGLKGLELGALEKRTQVTPMLKDGCGGQDKKKFVVRSFVGKGETRALGKRRGNKSISRENTWKPLGAPTCGPPNKECYLRRTLIGRESNFVES